MTTIQFCPECNNMLYPKEDRKERKLLFSCRHCDYEKPAPSSTVYVNKIKKDTAMRLDLVDPALKDDVTLPRAYDAHCEKCNGNEAVFFMSRSGGKDSDMALVFLCVAEDCHHKWLN